ncbi:MAG: FxSxx-COOH system tetratricopeptide repeat protein [Nakamurella sp.]
MRSGTAAFQEENTVVEINILGPLEVREGAESQALGGTKQCAVLAILALHANAVVSTEMLVDGVWGADASERAFNAIQVYVSRLRKILNQLPSNAGGPGLLQRRNPGYLLRLDEDNLDLGRFSRLAQRGQRALLDAPEAAADTLRAALDLWRGPALVEFAGLPFATPEITRLEEIRLATLGARVEADLVLGRHAELVGELEAQVAAHPLHEQLHQQLILSLYRSGRQAAALEAFRRARGLLSDELGVDPGRPLQELEAAILAHDPALDWVPIRINSRADSKKSIAQALSPAAPIHRGLPEIWNVPARNPHFTGRSGLLDELRGRLDHQDTTLVVQAMYGMGGVGKSQLVIEYAHRYGTEYGLAWWIDAEQPVLIPQQVDRLAQRLGLTAGAAADSVERLKAHLAYRSDWLLIFDNAERVEDVAPFRPASGGNILVTSRYPGWGALGGRLQVDVLDRSETVALLLERLPATEPELADRLAAELGDLPLAVAQAAAYMEQTGMDPAEYLRHFTSRRAALIARGDVVDYQGRVDTAWELSLEKLRSVSPRALELMELSAFLAPEPVPLRLFGNHEPLTAQAAGELDGLTDAVGAAVSFSLIRRLPNGFQLHRLIQAAIRLRMTPADSERAGASAADLLAKAHPGDPNDPANWPDYAMLAPHILAIGSYGDRNPGTRRLMLDLVAYLSANAAADSGRRVGTDLLARWRLELGDEHHDTLLLATYLTLALVWLGRAGDARELGGRTLPLARRVLGSDHPDTVRLAIFLMMATAWMGDAEGAKQLATDSLERIRRVLPQEHPDGLRLTAYVALALIWAGDRTARSLAKQTMKLATSALGPNHPTTLLAATDLCIGLLWESDPNRILELAADTHRRALDTLGNDHLITLGSGAVRAQALVWTGQVEESLVISREFSGPIENRLGPDHFISLMASAALASAVAEAADGAAIPRQVDAGAAAAGTTRPVGQVTYERAARVLGPDHPITLIAAAAVLTSSAVSQVSSSLERDTQSRAERVLGADHPLTISLLREARTAC